MSNHNKSLSSTQLALQSQMILDIPPRMRGLLIIVGITGVIIIFMEGLISGRPSSVHLDKIVHFIGYATIATVLVLGLRPILMIPALIGLVGVSIAAEYVQAMFGRMFEYGDMIANAAGVGFGLFIGLTIRFLYGYIRKELTFAHIRKNLLRFDKGEMILKQGEPLEKFYLIKKGKVDLYRTVEVERDHVLTVGPGETIGALGVILGETQYTDAVASEYTEIYGLGLDELMDSAGGKDQPVSLLLLQAAEYVKKTNEEIVQLRKK